MEMVGFEPRVKSEEELRRIEMMMINCHE